MTAGQIRAVMQEVLAQFNDEGVTISDSTVHDTVLSDDDGFGSASSKRLYKGLMRWTFEKNGHPDEQWPPDWMSHSVADLADELA